MVSTRSQNVREISRSVNEIDKACGSAGLFGTASTPSLAASTATPPQSFTPALNTEFSRAYQGSPTSNIEDMVSGSPMVHFKQETLPAPRSLVRRARRNTRIDFTVSKVTSTQKTEDVLKSKTIIKTEVKIKSTSVSAAASGRRGIKRGLSTEGMSSQYCCLDMN